MRRWGVLTGAPHLNCPVAAVGESLGREGRVHGGGVSAGGLGAQGLPSGGEPVLTEDHLHGLPELHPLTLCLGPPRPAQWLCFLAEAGLYPFLRFQFLYLLWGPGMGPSSLPLLLEASSPLGSPAWGQS